MHNALKVSVWSRGLPATLQIPTNFLFSFGGGDSWHFGPMCLLSDWCRECFAACVVFFIVSKIRLSCANSQTLVFTHFLAPDFVNESIQAFSCGFNEIQLRAEIEAYLANSTKNELKVCVPVCSPLLLRPSKSRQYALSYTSPSLIPSRTLIRKIVCAAFCSSGARSWSPQKRYG